MLGQAQAYASLRDVEAAEDILGKVRSNLPDSRQGSGQRFYRDLASTQQTQEGV